MSRFFVLFVAFFGVVFSGCRQSAETTAPAQNAQSQTTPTASPVASPNTMAVAPTLATPPPSGAVVPPPNGKDAPKNLPNVIGDRLYRALTLEEINQLPPETRDAILRAQGRLPASPAPKKK